MTVQRGDFARFFRAVHGGHAPFAWQWRLLDHVLDARAWPAVIDAPTGSGKTAAIDVHVFALAVAAATGGPLPPRRLSMVVGRRVLVDDQYQHARELREALARPDDEVVGAVAERLWLLRDPDGKRQAGDDDLLGRSPLITARLRGGEPPSRSWTDEPTAAAVLCATPDMWGSRLLFRGYGASRRSWPRTAGLLAFDSAVVVDEAHLSTQLLTTARRVGELAVVAEGKSLGAAPLQVVETSATPADRNGSRIGVRDDDLDTDRTLGERLTRPKPVALVPSRDWTVTTPRSRAIADISDAVIDLIDRLPATDGDRPRTVGCFVNTVARAVAVAHELRGARSLEVVMLCGQVRPIDVEPLRASLLTVRGEHAVDVIVSTQTLEVGVDLDLAGLVTELAGGSALVQRAGRVNRLGRRPSGPITVVVPQDELKDGTRSGPYDTDELRDALAWLRRRAADPAGLAPWSVRDDRPRSLPRRVVYERPEWAQAEHWARTSDDLAADPRLDLWLGEDVGRADELSLGLVVRDSLPDDDADARALLLALAPRGHEIFPVPYRLGRAALAAAHERSLAGENDDPPVPPLRALIVREDDVVPLTWTQRDRVRDPFETEYRPRWVAAELRPGDTVVVDSRAALFTAAVGAEERRSPPVLVPADDDTTRHRAPDVLERPAELSSPRPGEVVHRVELEPEKPVDVSAEQHEARLVRLRRLASDLDGTDEENDLEVGALLAAWLADEPGAMAKAAHRLLASAEPVDTAVHRNAEGRRTRVVIVDRRRAQADEDIRQEWTPRSGSPPTLAAHQAAVEERARALSAGLGLTGDLVDALAEAGRLHDEGKADPRFQTLLGPGHRGEAMAKSGARTPLAVRRAVRRAGLPAGWRHEQRSVVEAWAEIAEGLDHDLVARLIGTSHGCGRSGFPHTADGLLQEPSIIARELFDEGRWDELIDTTHRRYGLWGCAYLEAVLRAADGQISREGR